MRFYLQAPPLVLLEFNQIGLLANHYQLLSDKDKERISHIPHIFLDNMTFEGCPISSDDYIKIVNELKPELFALPDVYNDINQTFELHAKYFDMVDDSLKANAMVHINDVNVPDDFINWIFKSDIKNICLGYFDNYSRYLPLLRILTLNDEFTFHLLGIESLTELIHISFLSKVFNISSCDSTIVYTTSKSNLRFKDAAFAKAKIAPDQIDDDELDKEIFLDNIRFLESFDYIVR